jgi:hypothetical protein
MTDSFWEAAFDPRDPFREELIGEFRRGVIHGQSRDLTWVRMAIYSLSDGALWPVVGRLVQLADIDPSAEFVESLVFFLSNPESLERVRTAMSAVPPDAMVAALNATESLMTKLTKRGDIDLSRRLESFAALLRVAPL